jgi:hypothetical protein
VGLTAEGDEQLGMKFEREELLGARDRVPEVVTLGLARRRTGGIVWMSSSPIAPPARLRACNDGSTSGAHEKTGCIGCNRDAADQRRVIARAQPPVQGSTAQRSVSSTRTVKSPGSGKAMLKGAFWGALSGAVLGGAFYALSDEGNRSSGCEPLNCALPFLTVSGAIAGMFIGHERDAKRRAFAPRAGQSLEYGFAEVSVRGAPTYIDVRDSLIAVVSDSGAQLLLASATPKALRPRAMGLSTLRQVSIMPERGTMALGTGQALWETGLLTGLATRLADGAVDALATSPNAILSATGSKLRLRTGTGDAARLDSTTMSQLVSAIAYDSIAHAWWVSTDSQVVQVKSVDDRLTVTTLVLPLPAAARAIATNGEWIAAALGDEGVIAWKRASVTGGPVTPVRVTQEPRFAYDLSFLGNALFVAGGVDGLFQIALEPTARVIGSSRQVQFATTVRASGGVLWVGDRVRQSVVRVTP